MSAIKEIVVDDQDRLVKAKSCRELNEAWKTILEKWERCHTEPAEIEKLWDLYIQRLENLELGRAKTATGKGEREQAHSLPGRNARVSRASR